MRRSFLLDTNFASEQTRPRPHPATEDWLDAQPRELLFLSAITVGEIRKGTALLAPGKRRESLEHWLEEVLLTAFVARVLPVTRSIAERCGVLSALHQQKGRPISLADGLIAATALEHGLTQVTRNTRDFAELGLDLVSPWQDA